MIEPVSDNTFKKNIIADLASSWNESGIDKGDTVLIHSYLSRFLKRLKSKGIDLTPNDILDSLIEAVGKSGTLIFPAYNFEFNNSGVFDIRNSKSETGSLTEAARLHNSAVRTGHPLFSFAVIGYHIDKFRNLYNYSAFGIDSPFAKLLELDGKIAALDIGGEFCMTFYHYVEETENAPNRFHKVFKGKYIDYDGKETQREFDVYSRKIEIGVVTDVKPMEDYLWSKGLYSGCRPGEGSCLHVIKAKTVYDEAAKIIKDGEALGMLYKIRKTI
ncbi:MAG: AAC(3) family N-acetyltransferase [Bacteroidota bacterium]|nr:AAC(3) family N-acetyltransferase [Bacteroidota bacterium]